MANIITEEPLESPAGNSDEPTPRKPRRRWLRRLGTVLVVSGVVLLAYGAAVYFWHDPVTDLYARWKQHQLDGQLAQQFEEFQQEFAEPGPSEAPAAPIAPEASDPESPPTTASPEPPPTLDPATLEQDVRRLANRYYARLELGEPLGRIIVPKLHQNLVFVNGTRWAADLTRGPGRYPETALPGMGKVTAIAGHRTTFGAPFRHIDRLAPGDPIVLELPYGTFHYRVTGHEIVDDQDWSVIAPRGGGDTLVLSACHPLYSASQRWIVFAELTEVETRDGTTFRPDAGEPAALAA